MRKLFAATAGLIALFALLMLFIAFSQRRTFPEDVKAIVFTLGHVQKIFAVDPRDDISEDDADLLLDPQRSPASFADTVDCSTDGDSILFFSDYLRRLNIEDKTLAQVAVEPHLIRSVAGSPDGRFVALIPLIVSSEPFLIAKDGSRLQALTNPEAVETSLAWSPGSDQIVFSAFNRNDPESNQELEIADVTTGSFTPIYEAAAHIGYVSWSPDGSRIAFTMAREDTSDIYVVHPDGSNLTRLTQGDTYNISPRWSPDSSLISYSARSSGGTFRLYVMDADGGSPYPVFFGYPTYDVLNQCWLRQPT